MSATLHRCQNCGYETDLINVLGVFEDNPHCGQCGLSASECDSKAQDELANMMAHNFHLSAQPQSVPTTPQVLPAAAPITFASQHYHHSGHQVRPDSSASTVLSNAGVDPSVLLPSQLLLFRDAAPDQQRRLIELWRIAPPTYGNQMAAKDLGNWPQTSMQQEEEAARVRWEQSEGYRLKNLAVPPSQRRSAEPYIDQGYESMTSHDSMEASSIAGPSHSSRGWWEVSESEPVEHQYGKLQHMQMYGQNEGQHREAYDADEDMS